jgi:hypothetical protein
VLISAQILSAKLSAHDEEVEEEPAGFAGFAKKGYRGYK